MTDLEKIQKVLEEAFTRVGQLSARGAAEEHLLAEAQIKINVAHQCIKRVREGREG